MIAAISDVHGNLPALGAVLAQVDALGVPAGEDGADAGHERSFGLQRIIGERCRGPGGPAGDRPPPGFATRTMLLRARFVK